MYFELSPEILEQFPEVSIGLVVAKGINNTESDTAYELLKKEIEEVKQNWTTEKIVDDPRLLAWREAYKSFKAKPKKYKCSVENLYRMLLSDVELSSINPLVDLYNAVSLKHCVPLGGDDLDKIDGGITLAVAKGDEKFIQLNGSEATSPKAGEVIYRDESEVLCRRWNWRECDKSKMTNESQNVCLVVEGLPPTGKNEVEKIAAELGEEVSKHCGGSIGIFILNAENPRIEV